VLIACFCLFGCGGKDQSSPTNQYGLSTKNQIIWWQLADATNIIPGLNHDVTAQYVAQFIWESLNGADYQNNLVPGVAGLPEISEDHLTYTYSINPKAHFSDGKPLTGDDVVFSFKTVMNPFQVETASLKNYMNALDSVSFVGGDKMKVAFHMSEPYFQNDLVLGGGYVKIMPKHIFDPEGLTDQMDWVGIKSGNPKNADVFKKQAAWFASADRARDPKYLIGSGSYLFEEWKTNQYISLKRDKNYWGQDIPWLEAYPERIILKTITDYNAAATAIKAKDIDLIDNISGAVFASIDTAKHPFIQKDTVYYNAKSFIQWNNESPIFSDKRVRWAMGHLIDRDLLIKEISKGLARANNSVINFTQPFHDASLPAIKFDPTLAKAMLAEAGWTDSDGDGILDKVINGRKTPFEFTFMNISGNEAVKQATLVISEQMKKVGIKADLASFEWSIWVENTRTHKFDAALSNTGGNASEDDPFQQWHSSQAKNKGFNTFSFKNAEADKLLEMNRVEFDKAKRAEYMKRFQQIVYDEQPVTFLWSTPARIVHLKRFGNVRYVAQRPCFDLHYWIVKGSGIVPKQGSPSTVAPPSAMQPS
jgi:peptide/nickel transport system substrate-binding protein